MATFKELKELTKKFKTFCQATQKYGFSVSGSELIGEKNLKNVWDKVSKPYDMRIKIEHLVFDLYQQLAIDLGIKMPESTADFFVSDDYVLSSTLEEKFKVAQEFFENKILKEQINNGA